MNTPPPAQGKTPPPAQQDRNSTRDPSQLPPARQRQPMQPSQSAVDPEQAIRAEIEPAVVSEGRNGEKNLRIEWIDVRISPNWTSCRFDVRSLPGHRLEAQIEQLAYRKSLAGEGQFQTEILPIAPHGTTGKLIVHDLDTGETLEQCWRWYEWGGAGFLAWLIGVVRKLFAKPGR